MNRIEVSSAGNGDPVRFTFPVNPTIYDPVDEANVAENAVLHAPAIYQNKSCDSRTRTMEWKGHEVGWDDISSVVTYFRSIEGEIRYFNFNDLDDINLRWDTTNAVEADWKKARIITVKTKPRPGGKLVYDYVKLLLQPE